MKRNRKWMPCECHPEGHNALWFLSYDFTKETPVSYWGCANCCAKKPVGKTPKAKLFNGMTAAQHRTMEILSSKTYKGFSDKKAHVDIGIEVLEYFVSLTITCTSIMESGFSGRCHSWHIFVYKGGRCEAYDTMDIDKRHKGIDACVMNYRFS